LGEKGNFTVLTGRKRPEGAAKKVSLGHRGTGEAQTKWEETDMKGGG